MIFSFSLVGRGGGGGGVAILSIAGSVVMKMYQYIQGRVVINTLHISVTHL